jgi:phosphatidate cytidylyltransferase
MRDEIIGMGLANTTFQHRIDPMASSYLHFVFIYVAFLLLATLLTIARRWLKPEGQPSDTWKKYPLYVFFNLTFVCAIWMPYEWHSVSILLSLLGYFASREIGRALGIPATQEKWLPWTTAMLILLSDWLSPIVFVQACVTMLFLCLGVGSLALKYENIARNTAHLASSLVFLPWCLATFIWIWKGSGGQFNAIFVYGVIATNDAFAQITGQLFGKNQLAPNISPGKTIEGTVGGLLFAAVMGSFLFAAIGLSRTQGFLVGVLIGVAGFVGDLTFSSWKRAAGLKDFGNLLGAHGGVLDRFDSLIFAAPVYFVSSGLFRLVE